MITAFPTNNYPGIYFTTSRSVEAGLPVTMSVPIYDVLATDNLAASGIRETIVLRREERRQLTFYGLDAIELDLWRQYFQDHGALGKQAELLVDRFTGRVFTFPNSLSDQNLNAASLFVAPTWTVFSGKAALDLTGVNGTFNLGNSAGSRSNALVNSGGVIIMTFVPGFASGNSATNYLFDAAFPGALTTNRLRCWKSASNQLDFEVLYSNGSRHLVRYAAASWAANVDAITVVCAFTQTGSPALWFNTVQATNYPDTATGATLGTLTNTITVHHDAATANFADMKLLLLGFYKYAYDDPTILASYFPLGRNYYGTAELMERSFTPQRIAPTVDAWQFAWNFRVGI